MLPASAPNRSESAAITTRSPPYRTITPSVQPALISFTKFAMIKGMMHSIATSNPSRIGVAIETFLYSRMLFASFLNICIGILSK